jgi:hypothetical protein
MPVPERTVVRQNLEPKQLFTKTAPAVLRYARVTRSNQHEDEQEASEIRYTTVRGLPPNS